MAKPTPEYQGFEQGPIRPPSEAQSLLIRVVRNCPWNRCTFCPVYKGTDFSLRPVEHVLRDIDAVSRVTEALERGAEPPREDRHAQAAAFNWYRYGMKSVFLQDANALAVAPDALIAIIEHLRQRFANIERVTAYARSQSITRLKPGRMEAIGAAGLDRIHIGLESGSDTVLRFVKKGPTKAKHIEAGQRVKAAGIELSEYYMPGLGGREWSREHAVESADALNRIDPDFIRLRSLAVPSSVPLFDDLAQGRFEKCTDRMVVEELLVFLEHLDGITSRITSDHVLNLLGELEGKLPEDKPRLLAALRRFLDLSPQDQMVYQVGRRLGAFHSLDDLADPRRTRMVEENCRAYGITPDNVDTMIDELMQRFI